MEARVAKLESDVSHLVKQVDRIDSRLSSVADDVATLKTDVAVIKATMAGKGFIVGTTITTIGLVVALLTLLSRLGILATG